MERYHKLVIFEAIIIILLLAILIITYFSKDLQKNSNNKFQFISSGVSSGILPSENFLIFNFQPLKQDIQNYLDSKNLNSSVYVSNLRDGAHFGIRENEPYEALSFNKLPTAIIILKKIEKGELTLDSLLSIPQEYRDPNSGTLYSRNVDKLSVKELLRYILEESDNTAFWVLASQISLEEGEQLTYYLDFYKDYTNRTTPSENLQISAKSIGNIFTSLYLSTILQPEHSELILEYLVNTSFDIKKYAHLPKQVAVSQKYGSSYYGSNKLFHSCGIMYIQDSRIFYCVMNKELDRETAEKTIGDIVNKIYSYVLANKR